MHRTPARLLRRAFVAGLLPACGIAQAAYRQWQPVRDWAAFVGADIARMKAISERAQIKAD